MKRIVTIQDFSCVGNCSLTAAIPVLSAAGVECCGIPTALLSNHTGFPTFYSIDLTDELAPIGTQLKKEHIDFDGIYTGYIASVEQVDHIEEFIRQFRKPGTPLFIDPVMGDNGRMYAALTDDYPARMQKFIAGADMITPNITEACLLTGRSFNPCPTLHELTARWNTQPTPPTAAFTEYTSSRCSGNTSPCWTALKRGTAMANNPKLHKAVIFLIASAFFFALMNMFVRLSGDIPTIQKTFFRNFFALFIASGAMIKNRCSIIPPKGARLDVLLRSVFGYTGVICNFYAIDRLPLSDASLLNKMSPFFAIVFSTFLLKERANKIQWSIIIMAFIGALFVIKPSFQNADLGASIAGFCGGMCAGAAYTFVRKATGKGVRGYYVVFFFSAFSTLAALPLTIAGFKPMTWFQLLMLIGAGVSAAIAQFCITTAYSYAPAKEVSIYDYSQIIFAALLGFIVFDQIPDILSFVGYIIIIVAAFIMFRYNNRKHST